MMEPKRFFEVALPHMLVRSLADFLEAKGAIVFEVRGVGQWSFVFGSDQPVRRGYVDEAGLRLTVTRKAFDQFLHGTLDTAKALAHKEVLAVGTQFELLEAFARILEPPATDLGWNVDTKG